jgi:hypothetical protein
MRLTHSPNKKEKPVALKAAENSFKKKFLNLHRMKALEEYILNGETTTKIAARHGFSPSTLTVLAHKAGIPLRSRGRRTETKPSPIQKKILQMTQHATYEAVGIEFGCSKQRVFAICNRWRAWLDENYPPIPSIKVKPPAPKHRPTKSHVVSFRVTEKEWCRLTTKAKRNGFTPLSANQYARIIVAEKIQDGGDESKNTHGKTKQKY